MKEREREKKPAKEKVGAGGRRYGKNGQHVKWVLWTVIELMPDIRQAKMEQWQPAEGNLYVSCLRLSGTECTVDLLIFFSDQGQSLIQVGRYRYL